MPIILAAIVLATAIGAGVGLALWTQREPVYIAQPGESVRVGDPGHNLVGQDWSGNVRAEQGAESTGAANASPRRQ